MGLVNEKSSSNTISNEWRLGLRNEIDGSAAESRPPPKVSLFLQIVRKEAYPPSSSNQDLPHTQ